MDYAAMSIIQQYSTRLLKKSYELLEHDICYNKAYLQTFSLFVANLCDALNTICLNVLSEWQVHRKRTLKVK